MKVILLCSNYEPGGAQRAAIRLNNEFKKQGIDCRNWFFHKKSEKFSDIESTFMLNRKISGIIDILKICINLKRKFKQERPDAVISFLPYANILGQFIALLSGVKIRVCSHRNISNKELSLIQKIIDFSWVELGVYTSITAVSKSTKESFKYYRKKHYDKIEIINNGIVFNPSTMEQQECRNKFGISHSVFVIGNIGRLVVQKNQILLIEILPKLPNILLLIIGKGELKDSLLTRAKELGVIDKLLIIDELKSNEIPIFFKSIDVFAMPSYYEGMSNALIEALYAGVPIVSSDVVSQRDVLIRVKDGLNAGILLSNDEPKEWIKAFDLIRCDRKFKEELQKNAIIRSKDFSVKQMADKFINII